MCVVYINTMCTPPTHTTTYTIYIFCIFIYQQSGGFNLISSIFWKCLDSKSYFAWTEYTQLVYFTAYEYLEDYKDR